LDIQWDGDNQMNIKDENGTRYYFGRLDQQTAVESIVPYEPSGFSNAISAWYLLKVVAANGVDEIRFDYISSEGLIDTPLYSTQLLRTKDVNFNTVVGFEYQKQNYSTLTQVKYVSSITFKNGKVTFDYQTDRQDASNGAKRLKRVNVWAEENVGDYQLVRFFELAHSYFNCADGPTQSEYTVSSVHASTDWRLKRLRLDSVTEKSPANHALPPYSLTYYEDVPLPIYGAYAQDYWGFSNGASTNQNLLLWDAPNSSIEPSRQYGANREVSFTHALAGTLQQMTYPTQGKSVFVFEAPTKTNGTQVLQGGGIRIKRIINYDNTGGQTQKEYSYPGAYFTSNLYNGSFDGLDFHNLLLHTFEARGANCCDNVPYQTKTYPENLHFPLGTNSGSSLTYNQVEELSLDAANVASGKRVLKYRVMQDESYSYMPFYHINNGWQRGDLLEESLYKTGESNTLVLLNQTSHQYHFHQENLKIFNLPARISFTPRIVTCSDFGQFTCIYSYLPLCPDSFLPTIAHQFEYFSFSQQVGRYFLESTVITQYDESGNNPITHTLNYEYGESTHHQITKKSFTNRNNQVVETRYRYPHEKAVSGNVYAEMLNQHIFTPLIEEELHVGGQLQQLSRTNYKGWYPVSASLHAFYAPYSLETQLAGGSLTLQYTMGESLVAPSENGYSTQAQPLVYTLRNGLTTRLEWYDEHGKFDLLKKTTTLHLFDTYDYQPLIGLGRQRNQTALGSDFEYDGFGRLQTLRNAQNQVLKNYDYSYAGGVNTYNTVAERTARIETTNPADLTDVPNGRITLHHFDGLGRDAQTVEYKASPAFNDIVSQHISYDSYGRVQKTLLPVAMTGSSTVAWADPGPTAQSFYNGDVRPFAEIFYEASPLNRPKKSYGAGNTWFSNQKFVEKQYGTSSTTRRFELTANGLQKNGFYQHITTQTTISEQGHSVVEYFDVEGKLVQKDVQESAGNYLQTAYVYDELNRLKYVLQPKLYDWFNTNTILNEGQAEYQQGAFGYRYDTQGRLIEKHVPGGGKTEMVYDKYDRVVWQRTALGQELGKWTFLKYDALNRVIATGEKSESSERADLQEDADDSNLGHHEARIIK
jgi:YD repeat-containing protein